MRNRAVCKGAATLFTDVNGQLTGATGVTVGRATYDVAFADNFSDEARDRTAPGSLNSASADTGGISSLVFAQFTETAHVPLPAAGWLMLGGLGLLWGAARRR